jgi:hypothetical protein
MTYRENYSVKLTCTSQLKSNGYLAEECKDICNVDNGYRKSERRLLKRCGSVTLRGSARPQEWESHTKDVAQLESNEYTEMIHGAPKIALESLMAGFQSARNISQLPYGYTQWTYLTYSRLLTKHRAAVSLTTQVNSV